MESPWPPPMETIFIPRESSMRDRMLFDTSVCPGAISSKKRFTSRRTACVMIHSARMIMSVPQTARKV